MEVLARCRDLALPFYADLLKSAQPVLRERLFEQAEKSASNAEQRCFWDAIQVLERSAAPMVDAFDNHLLRGWEHFLAGSEEAFTAPSRTADELTLVAREQLEDDLAVSMIVSRANSQHAEALWKLNRRLALLRGGRQVTDDSNPFGPARVGAALRVAMAAVECDLKARIFIYKYLGKLLLAMFGRVLGMLNQTLVEAGVLPNLKFVITRQPEAEPAPAPTPAAAETIADPVEPREARQQLLDAVLGQLRARAGEGARERSLGGISYSGLATGGDDRPENFLPMDYALVLSALQQAPEFSSTAAMLRPLSVDAVEERLFGQLKRQARPEARHRLGQSDADTVDLVGAIFRYMLDDPGLPDVVKALLSHLHTPYLKLALLDAGMLQDEQHVARRLLDLLAEAGTRWVHSDQERVVLPKLKEVVETVLRGFVDDVTLFDRLEDDFLRFREGVERRAEMAERRSLEAQEGEERLQLARQRAGEEIERRIAGCALSEPIRRLLQKPWTDFLVFNYLRNGDDSLAWRSALKVVDGVLWSVGGEGGSAEERQRHRAQLEQAIAEGLRTIGYASEAAEALIGALRDAQELAPAVAATPAPAEAEAPRPLLPPEPELSPEEMAWAVRLREQTAFGTWFEFDYPTGGAQQLKLAWYSRVSKRYMFVNQAGVKQRVEEQATLARGLHAGTIRLVVPEPRGFLERALEAVLTRLRR